MSQSSSIAAFLIVAFIVYVTVKGELVQYFHVITGAVVPAAK